MAAELQPCAVYFSTGASMDCGLGTPEEISICIDIANRWLQVLINFAGLGTLALISILIWLFRRLRKDLKKWEEEAERSKEQQRQAEDTARQAESRAAFAEASATRAQNDLDSLRNAASVGEDEIRANLADVERRLAGARSQIDGALSLTAGGSAAFWSRPVGKRFDEYERLISTSIPILLFGNQKGGVGKSTLVTNLAAAFVARGERVLTVDLDYQGSHSNLAQLQSQRSNAAQEANDPESIVPKSLIDHLFQDDLDPNWADLCIQNVQTDLDYIPAFYDFEQTERRVEYQWALGLAQDDVRYRLARALLVGHVQEKYHRVLIDAPPRFTLGFVNGFCAATHMYVPTVVDSLSALAVRAFAQQFRDLRPIVNPSIRWPGIIGTMTFPNPRAPLQLAAASSAYADRAERVARARLGGNEPEFIRNPVVVRDAKLAHASANGIAYINDSSVRSMFDKLASVIEMQAPRRT